MKSVALFFILASALLLSADLSGESTRHWNISRGYSPFKYATDNCISISNPSDSIMRDSFTLPEPAEEMTLSFKAKILTGKPALSYSYETPKGKNRIHNPFWGWFFIIGNDTLLFSVRNDEFQRAIESEAVAVVSCSGQRDRSPKEVVIRDHINPYDGDNIWSMKIEKGNLRLMAGDHGIFDIADFQIPRGDISQFGFIAGWGARVEIRDINLSYLPITASERKTFDISQLSDYIANSADPLVGYWTLFDRELEEDLLKLGGNYQLACVKEGDNYMFIYLDGASVNSGNWTPGDVKLILSPTFFPGIYNVEWIDAMKVALSNEIKAQKESGSILSIQFPYHSSRLRLRKFSE